MKNKASQIITFMAMLALPNILIAQAAAPSGDPIFWEKAFGSLALFGGAIVIAGALYAIVRLFTIIMKMEELRILREKGVEEVIEAYRQPQESWWARFSKQATAAVPIEHEADVMLDHNYDGIRELDNKLPPWWLWMFYASIIFAPIYWGVYHMSSSAGGLRQEYEMEMETAKASVIAYRATQAENIDENNVAALTDAGEIALGKSVFEANCVACHGTLGEGGAGPNLTDEFWIHGGGVKNIFTTIKKGVPGKAMIAWGEQLRASDMQRLASYILTLEGTNPPNGKTKEGDVWKPDAETMVAPADTTTKIATSVIDTIATK